MTYVEANPCSKFVDDDDDHAPKAVVGVASKHSVPSSLAVPHLALSPSLLFTKVYLQNN